MKKIVIVGGCTSEIRFGNYKFDIDTTFFNILYIVEEIFEVIGRNSDDYVELYDLN